MTMMIMTWRCVVSIGKSESGFKVKINAKGSEAAN